VALEVDSSTGVGTERDAVKPAHTAADRPEVLPVTFVPVLVLTGP